jgi:HD superfamily phosphodiesterase
MNPNLLPLETVRAQVTDWLTKARAVTPGALIDNMAPAILAMRGIERDVVTIVTTLHEGLTEAEAERDALRARAEAAEAALATARADGAAADALLSDGLEIVESLSGGYDVWCDAVRRRLTGGPVEGA